jgi:bla regulator protein blaR1
MRSLILIPLLIAHSTWAQTEPKPVFEAASIKMSRPTGGSGHSHENSDPILLRASMTLKNYVMTAYDVKAYQVTGGPNWIDDSTYDIVAKLETTALQKLPGNLTPQQRASAEEERLHLALQALLGERFQLKVHHESKEMPAYALTVVKSGFKLKETSETAGCGTSSKGNGTSVNFTATCVGMPDFASYLARVTKQSVSDETRLQGSYSFGFEYVPDDLKATASTDQPAPPSLFTVLQQKLGLRLEQKKVPVDIIVVDGAERPSEN